MNLLPDLGMHVRVHEHIHTHVCTFLTAGSAALVPLSSQVDPSEHVGPSQGAECPATQRHLLSGKGRTPSQTRPLTSLALYPNLFLQ